MATLKVIKDDQSVGTLDIDQDGTYVIGRGEGCEFVLDPEPGVSRKHFQIVCVEGKCSFELLSRFGELYIANEKVDTVNLSAVARFSVPPYEFIFDPIGKMPGTKMSEAEAEASGDDRTAVMVLPSAAYLKLFNESGQNIQSFRLEGENWVAGRETTCPIFLDNTKISRRQFEIQRQEHSYFIRDLGSSNGTLLNGEAIPSNDWVPLNSSDLISVIDWTLQFELRDASYDERLNAVDPAIKKMNQVALNPGMENQNEQIQQNSETSLLPMASGMAGAPMAQGGQPIQPAAPQMYPQAYPNPYQQYPSMPPPSYYPPGATAPPPGTKKKMNPVRMAIIGIVVIAGLAYFLTQGSDSGRKPNPAATKDPFSKLAKEQQITVRQIYNNATQLYYQQKYQSARDELKRLHQILPYFEDSKNLELAAEQAIQLQIDQDRIRKKEEEQAQQEQNIQQQVAKCRAKLSPTITVPEIEACLDPVIALNPQHKAITDLRADVEKIISDRTASAAREREYNEAVARIEALFKKAQGQVKSENYRETILAFQRVAAISGPDPRGRRAEAKAQIAILDKKIAEARVQYVKKSDEYYKEGKIRDAILELEKAQKLDLNTADIENSIKNYMLELRKQMQNIYQEGVLEESVGEVEAAKAKWKKILEMSVPTEEYYKKSQLKLKKYGAI